jgi:hypothetical protein
MVLVISRNNRHPAGTVPGTVLRQLSARARGRGCGDVRDARGCELHHVARFGAVVGKQVPVELREQTRPPVPMGDAGVDESLCAAVASGFRAASRRAETRSLTRRVACVNPRSAPGTGPPSGSRSTERRRT